MPSSLESLTDSLFTTLPLNTTSKLSNNEQKDSTATSSTNENESSSLLDETW